MSGAGCGAPAPGPPGLGPSLLLPPGTAVPSPPSGLARCVRVCASDYFSAAVVGPEIMGKPLVETKRVSNKFAPSQSPYWLQVPCSHADTSLSKCSESGLLLLETCRAAFLQEARLMGLSAVGSVDQTS